MKRIYDTFEEMAEHFVDGECWTHIVSPHSDEECMIWQTSILEFAKWVDSAGIKPPQKPEAYEALWDR